MSIDHNDTSTLIEALDGWFEILRRRYNKPMPLKPTRPGKFMQQVPDLAALYGYTDGAWEDRKTPLTKPFLPVHFSFPSLARQSPVILETLAGDTAYDFTENHGFDIFHDRPWDQAFTVFQNVDTSDEITVFTEQPYFQAVAWLTFESFNWKSRRLHDIFLWAIELEEGGELDWSRGGPDYVDYPKHKTDFVANPNPPDPPEYGWRWEPIN